MEDDPEKDDQDRKPGADEVTQAALRRLTKRLKKRGLIRSDPQEQDDVEAHGDREDGSAG